MFRFTIRDVIWLTTFVAVLVAWRIDRGRMNDSYRQQFDIIRTELNAEYLSLEKDEDGVYHVLTTPAGAEPDENRRSPPATRPSRRVF